MRSSGRRDGFTVLELLVVIAILAVLAGLVFAVLAPAREQARRAVCISNFHQVGKAFAMYRADWDGIDPVKGIPMTYWQVGLPARPWVFHEMYGLFTPGGVMVCPSFHRILRDPRLEWSWRRSTYCMAGATMGLMDEADSTYLIKKRGPELVLLGCDQHNAFVEFEYEPQPEWATKLVFALHLDQHITKRNVPAAMLSCRDW
jgi:prepilin-type N-terminal cleavage/methylation domain-containing protein